MTSNKIAIRLLLSITIIFAGLLLLVGAKKEVHLYNLEEYESSAGSGVITFLATYDECHGHNSIPQPTSLQDLGLQVYCIERGGLLGSYGIPDDLSDLNNTGDSKTLYGLNKIKTKLYDLVGIQRDYKASRTAYKYTYDPSNTVKFKNLNATKPNYDHVKVGAEVSYIASCSPNHSTGLNWTPEKQVAMWLSGIGNLGGDGTADEGDGSIFNSTSYIREIVERGIEIYAQSLKYQEFINDTNHFTDNTNYNNIEAEKVTEGGHNYYIIGPFNMTYNGTYTPSPNCMSDEFWNTWFSENNPNICFSYNPVTFGGVTNFSIMLDMNGDGVYETPATIQGFGYSKNTISESFNLYYTNNGNPGADYGDQYVENSLYYHGNYALDGDGHPTQSGYVHTNSFGHIISFPNSGSNFYIKIDGDGINGSVGAKLSGQYDWMNYDEDLGVTGLDGTGKRIIVTSVQNVSSTTYNATVKLQERPDVQDLIAIKARRLIESIPFESSRFDITPPVMNIDGYVWNDMVAGKESLTDGLFTSGSYDKAMDNIKVTLYYADTNTMVPQGDLNPIGVTEDIYKINPTLTTNGGYYMFAGLDTSRTYYVEFEYNGQKFIPTDLNKTITGTPTPITNSQAVELGSERTTLDNRFQEIKSSPKSYGSLDNCNFNIPDNITFSNLELMGYKLTFDTTTNKYRYVQDEDMQLIDGYKYNDIGQQTSEYSQGIITTRIRQFINTNHRYPTDDELKGRNGIYNGIVNEIAGSNTQLAQEIKQKIQFIEDCKIKATTAKKSGGTFIRKNYSLDDATYDSSEHINVIHNVSLGLFNRQEFDLHLWTDANIVDVKVNGMEEEYIYNSPRNPVFIQNSEDYGDMYYRLSNAELAGRGTNKYTTQYVRKLYKSDFNADKYDINNTDDGIDIEIRYSIIIYNESLSVEGRVTEIVDNYLDSLEYVPRSITAHLGSMELNTVYTNLDRPDEAATIYDGTEEVITENMNGVSRTYNRLYIRGLQDVQIGSNQNITISLTFKAKTTNGHLDDSITKNFAEINGFKTFYKMGTALPNGVTINNSITKAGLIDCDSLPGNLQSSHLVGEHYEVNLQDDTDVSHTIRWVEDGEREINGTVWEDERTATIDGALIGDGKKDNNETKIQGVKVTLKEWKEADKKYVTAKIWKEVAENQYEWREATTVTDENGQYSIKGFLPGLYIVQFDYGDSYETVLSNDIENNETSKIIKNDIATHVSGKNENSYNGQDYKSTIFQRNMVGNEELTITDYSNNLYNVAGMIYNYAVLDNANVSDAMDLLDILKDDNGNILLDVQSVRRRVNNYSTTQTNHIAEVLASPYNVPKYPTLANGTEQYDENNNLKLDPYTASEMKALIDELIEKTHMTAITPNIIARVEYARDATSGSDGVTNGSGFSGNNGKNGKYTIPSVDFGLVERPRAQLEIEKEVENVKVTLSDGTILFDNTQGAKNIVWQDNKQWDVKGNEATLKEEGTSKYTKGETVYRNLLRDKLPGANKTGRIQVIIDNELMYGATIQIIYNVSIKNAGEVDYVGNKYVENKLVNEFEFYAKGITSDNNGISTVKSTTTSADEVICYIPNNMQFDKNIPLTESENDKWDKTNINSIYDTGETLTDEELIQHVTGANRVNNNLVNEKLKHSVETFNTIITTNELSEELTLNLNRVKTLKLIVSELMTKSAEDDLSYESIVEIVKTTNTVGRRMAYSVVGNQHPYQAPAEVDASKGEVVQVLPPFGTSNVMYYALALAVAAILGVGIFLIKKKVVK